MLTVADLLGYGQEPESPLARYDIYDMPNAGPSPSPTPSSQAGMQEGQSSGWMRMLSALAKQGGSQGWGQSGGLGSTVRPPTAGASPLPPSAAASKQGFISDSRTGFNMDDLMKVAAIVGSMGMATPAVAGMAGAAGAGGAAAGGAAGGMGGMGGMGGIMGMFGGMGGGGGGGGQAASPPMTYAPLPQQPGPLMPQSAMQWSTRENPWLFQG